MSTVLERPPMASASRPLAGWRALLRLARRDAWRYKGRTTLVVLLIAIPVAALFAGAVLMRSGDLSEHQHNLLQLGATADALVADRSDEASEFGPSLPAGWRRASIADVAYGRVKLGDRYRFVNLRAGDLTDPLLRGAVDVRAGRAPAVTGEAAVSTAAARKFGVSVGDTIVVRRGGVALTVVGTFESANDVNAYSVLTATPLAGPAVPTGTGAVWVKAPDGTTDRVLRDTLAPGHPSWLVTRTDTDRPDESRPLPPVVALYTVGTIGLFVVGIVVSAAFAVGARRQLRTLGLAGATGADPRQLRAVVTAQGVVAGVVGVIVGGALGAAAIAAIAPHLNRALGFRVPGLRILPIDLGLVAGLAVVTATVAAYLPARTAARVPTLAALGGRRPLRPVPIGVPVFGVVLFGLGLLLLALSVAGDHTPLGTWFRLSGSTVLLLLGAVLCMPWVMGRLEPLAGRLRGPARLAARGMARHRSRTGPITAAILAAAGGAVAVATFAAAQARLNAVAVSAARNVVQLHASDPDGDRGEARPPADVVERIRRILGGALVIETAWVSSPDPRGQLVVAAPGTAAAAGLAVLTTDAASLQASGAPAAAVEAWRAGRSLARDLGPLDDRRLALEVRRFDASGVLANAELVRTITLDALNVPPLDLVREVYTAPACAAAGDGSCPGRQPQLVVPPDVIAANGWTVQGASVSVVADHDLTVGERRELRRFAGASNEEAEERLAAGGDGTYVGLNFWDDRRAPDWLQVILGGLVTAAALAVTAVGLALSAAEGRSDEATLVALGAPPRLRRRVRAWEALFTAGIAGVLAVPLGFVPAAVAIANRRREVGDPGQVVGFPWRMALLVAVGVPLVAAAVAFATGRSRRGALLRDD